jgi:hypothetical protein
VLRGRLARPAWTALDNDIRIDESVMRPKDKQMKHFRSKIKVR